MNVREAEPGEGALIATEFWYPLAEEMVPYSELNELTDDARSRAAEGFEDLLARDDWFAFFLEEAGDPVACLTGELGVRPSRERGAYASIDDLYVREGWRGEGRATRLLEAVEELAAAEGCDFVRASAEWENEAARSLYEALDYDRKQVTYAKTLE